MERYWITGAQLGTLIGLIRAKKLIEAKELIDEILDKQFIGRMKEPYENYEIKIVKKLKN